MAKSIDDVCCPRCNSMTLVTSKGECKNGKRYRYCSYVSCDWGLNGHDVEYVSDLAPTPTTEKP